MVGIEENIDIKLFIDEILKFGTLVMKTTTETRKEKGV